MVRGSAGVVVCVYVCKYPPAPREHSTTHTHVTHMAHFFRSWNRHRRPSVLLPVVAPSLITSDDTNQHALAFLACWPHRLAPSPILQCLAAAMPPCCLPLSTVQMVDGGQHPVIILGKFGLPKRQLPWFYINSAQSLSLHSQSPVQISSPSQLDLSAVHHCTRSFTREHR